MILVVGLLILAAAAVFAVAGFFTNTGSAHTVNGAFSIFGHHMTGSTGTLFLFGIIVGAAAMLGLGLLLTGARRTSRRGLAARRELRRARRETAAVERHRDVLAGQRDQARARTQTLAQERDEAARQRDDLAEQRQGQRDRAGRMSSASAGTNVEEAADGDAGPTGEEPHGLHLFGRRAAHRRGAA